MRGTVELGVLRRPTAHEKLEMSLRCWCFNLHNTQLDINWDCHSNIGLKHFFPFMCHFSLCELSHHTSELQVSTHSPWFLIRGGWGREAWLQGAQGRSPTFTSISSSTPVGLCGCFYATWRIHDGRQLLRQLLKLFSWQHKQEGARKGTQPSKTAWDTIWNLFYAYHLDRHLIADIGIPQNHP